MSHVYFTGKKDHEAQRMARINAMIFFEREKILFKEEFMVQTAWLERDFALGINPESTSKEHPPKKNAEKDSADNERVAVRINVASCWSSGIQFPKRLSIKLRLYPCGLQGSQGSLSDRGTCIQNDCEWGQRHQHASSRVQKFLAPGRAYQADHSDVEMHPTAR